MIDVTVDRHKYIGGSDIPIIMGISPFKSRFDLLLEKAELKDNDFVGNDYTEYGNAIEPLIRKHINESGLYGQPFKEDRIIVDDYRYHDDGFNGETVLEIKSTSQIKETLKEYKLYLVQNIFGIKLRKKKKGLLAVYERPEDFREQLKSGKIEFDPKRLKLYPYSIDDFKDWQEEIDVAVDQFQNDLVKLKANPLITEEDLQPKELIELSNQVIAVENQLAMFKELEDKHKKMKEQLKNTMEKYQKKKWTTPNGTKITLVADGEDKEVEVKKVDTEKFKKENANLISDFNKMQEKYNEAQEKYTTTEKQIKKGRSGYIRLTLPKEK